MPRPGNSWACSTNIFTLLAGKPCPGCTNPLFFLPLLDYCACVWDPHHTTCINKLKVIQEFAAKLATGLWFPGCQDPIQIMNWLPLACCMPKRAKAAAVQTYSAWFNHTTLSIDSSPPPFSQAPSVYGIVLSYHKNICPSSLLLPKCCHTMEQAVIMTSSLLTHKLFKHHLNQVVL